jgi:hypothetical protein
MVVGFLYKQPAPPALEVLAGLAYIGWRNAESDWSDACLTYSSACLFQLRSKKRTGHFGSLNDLIQPHYVSASAKRPSGH